MEQEVWMPNIVVFSPNIRYKLFNQSHANLYGELKKEVVWPSMFLLRCEWGMGLLDFHMIQATTMVE